MTGQVVAPAIDVYEGSRWLIGFFAMLFSYLAIAENTGKITLSPAYDDRLTEEVYDSGRGWRTPPAYGNEWRPEKQQEESRIEFGFDSTYEALRMRGGDQGMNAIGGLQDPKPATLFRIRF